MNGGYDACRLLYRTARTQESSSSADRRAVRMALATAIATGLQVATAGAASASASAGASLVTVSVGASGVSVGATEIGATAVGAKGILELLVGGKFLSGLLFGAALGTAVTTTALVVQPRTAAGPSEVQQVQRNSARRTASVPTSAKRVAVESQAIPERREGSDGDATAAMAAQDESLAELRASGSSGTPTVAPPRRAGDPSIHLAAEGRRNPLRRGLVEETQALARVQLALNERDPTKALELIESQERQFPSGQLAEERAAVRILALCADGRVAQADDARSRFQAAYPNSPLAKRVASACERW